MNERSTLTDLLQPSLQGKTAEVAASRKKPWGLRSLFFVAFFGGLLALMVMASLNARRLDIAGAHTKLAMIAVAAFVLLTGYVLLLPHFPILDFAGGAERSIRLGGRVIALLAYVLYARILGPFLQVYTEVHDSYAAPWVAGLLAVFGLGTLQAVTFTLLYLAAGGSA